VIVRLMGEGQYRVGDDLVAKLDKLDNRAVAAVDRDDEADLDAALDEMADLVRAEGERLSDDEITPSDVIIPPSDLSLEETRMLFAGHGLVPDLPV
jgi:chromosome condensin MukBEF complex kleisin-like MukF subunit